MKIIALIFLIFIFAVLACTQEHVQPYRFGKYNLVQKYGSSERKGLINFYSDNKFYVTIATTHDYYYELKNGRIHATCVDCDAHYIFHITNKTEKKETWTANLSGSFFVWEISN